MSLHDAVSDLLDESVPPASDETELDSDLAEVTVSSLKAEPPAPEPLPGPAETGWWRDQKGGWWWVTPEGWWYQTESGLRYMGPRRTGEPVEPSKPREPTPVEIAMAEDLAKARGWSPDDLAVAFENDWPGLASEPEALAHLLAHVVPHPRLTEGAGLTKSQSDPGEAEDGAGNEEGEPKGEEGP